MKLLSCHRPPAIARVVFGDRGCSLCRLFAQILLVHDAVVSDDKAHDPGVSVIGWISQNGESVCHVSVYDVVLGAALGGIALFREYAEMIPAERVRLLPRFRVACDIGKVTHLADRARRLSGSSRPVQTVL